MLAELKFTYSRMADEDLLVIVHSQMSFRPGAQDLAREILLQRGMSASAIHEWRHPDAEFPVRSWSSGKSDLQLRRMFYRRWQLDRITFFLLTLINVLLFGVFLYNLFKRPVGWQNRIEALVAICNIFIFLLWLRITLQIFSLRAPLRILILRPFKFPDSRRLTRRFAKHYLRYLGHTYTISDTEVKQRWAIFESLQSLFPLLLLILFGRVLFDDLIPHRDGMIIVQDGAALVFDVVGVLIFDIIITGWFFLLFRPSFNIGCDAEVSSFKDFMGRKRARNIAWSLSWDKLFKITCAPQTWKYTIQQLINSSQLIIVDLSRVGENMIWELEELLFYNAIHKVILIAHEKNAYSARSFLASGRLVEYDRELFVYRDDGLVARQEQLIAMITSIAASSSTVNK